MRPNPLLLLAGALVLAAAAAGAGVSWQPRHPVGPGRAQVVEVTAEAGMRFSGQIPGPPLRVRAGATVRLVLENRDTLAHDVWVVQAQERPPYLEPTFPGAKTRVLAPGEREEIQFTPTRPGRYRYVCTVPGHDTTMYGEFVVE
jgi:uncharacterized cupredoxin-like copper-binding protein